MLLRFSLGGLTLTLLEQDPPPGLDTASSLAQVSQVFFRELAFFKDSMFSERDFHHLRASFAKACPHSHLRYKHTIASSTLATTPQIYQHTSLPYIPVNNHFLYLSG